MDEQKSQEEEKKKKRIEHLPLGGVILVIFGVTWLLANLGITWVWDIWVPVVVILIGAYMLLKKQRS